MKSPSKSPTFIIGLVLEVLGIIFIFIGQTRGIGELLLFVGGICMLIPLVRSMLRSPADPAPKKVPATTSNEALHAMFSHLHTTSSPQTTSSVKEATMKVLLRTVGVIMILSAWYFMAVNFNTLFCLWSFLFFGGIACFFISVGGGEKAGGPTVVQSKSVARPHPNNKVVAEDLDELEQRRREQRDERIAMGVQITKEIGKGWWEIFKDYMKS